MILTVRFSFETVQSLRVEGANKETVIMASVGQCSGPQEIRFIGERVRVCPCAWWVKMIVLDLLEQE